MSLRNIKDFDIKVSKSHQSCKTVRERPRGKSADHQSLLLRAKRNAQRE